MKRAGITSVALCALLAVSSVAAGELEDIVAKHLAARGGLAKLEAIDSVQISGKMNFPGAGMEVPILFKWKKPNKLRVEFTFQGLTGVQAYDGKAGWGIMPFEGKTGAEPLSEGEAKLVEEQADFHGPFVDSAEKGYKLEYLGREAVAGKDAHKIKVTNKYGAESLVYLDAERFLEIKSESKRVVQEQELEIETSQGDYREVAGLMLAHAIESKPKGLSAGQTIVFEKIELNVDIPDSVFALPEKPAQTAANP